MKVKPGGKFSAPEKPCQAELAMSSIAQGGRRYELM
jgi:hypothetical protein